MRFGDFQIRTYKTDNRRHKLYYRTVRAQVCDWVPKNTASQSQCMGEETGTLGTRMQAAVAPILSSALEAAGLPENTNVKCKAHYDYNDQWSVVLVFHAERPSTIIDEETAKKVMEYLIPTLEKVVADFVDEWVRGDAQHKIEKEAEIIVAHFMKQISDRAIKAISYQEKLAALSEELHAQVRAEAEAQFHSLQEILWDSGEPVRAEVVERAVEETRKKVEHYRAPHRRLPFER